MSHIQTISKIESRSFKYYFNENNSKYYWSQLLLKDHLSISQTGKVLHNDTLLTSTCDTYLVNKILYGPGLVHARFNVSFVCLFI